jgi:acyl-coenzyme A thioesterase PaaI-like protein
VDVTTFDPDAPIINEDTVGHHCFGCGSANPSGLHLRFRARQDGGVWVAFTPTRVHEGYLGMTHGGILATLADEAMSWAVTHAGDLGVTARMTLTFRGPARRDEALLVSGWVTARRGRVIETRAEVRAAGSDALIAEAEGRFVRVSREQATAWREGYGIEDPDTSFSRAALRDAER